MDSPRPPLAMDAIREAVVRRHNVMIDRDDPILVTVTLMDEVLARHLEQVNESVATIEERGAAMMVQQISEVKNTTERLVSGSAKYFEEQVKAAADRAVAQIQGCIQERLNAALQASLNAQSAMRWSVIASAVGVGAALILVGFIFGRV